jgi:hypothetical protein
LQVAHICQRVAHTLGFFAREYLLLSRAVGKGYGINSRDMCKRVAPVKKKVATWLKYL